MQNLYSMWKVHVPGWALKFWIVTHIYFPAAICYGSVFCCSRACRWRPAPGYGQKGGQDGRGVIPGKAEDEIDWYLIDYLKIPRVKP